MRPLTIVGGDRERPMCPRRGRGRDGAPAALDRALLGGPSTSSLDAMEHVYAAAHWFRFAIGLGALPVLILAAALLHRKSRRKSTLWMLIGLSLAFGGTLLQLFSP